MTVLEKENACVNNLKRMLVLTKHSRLPYKEDLRNTIKEAIHQIKYLRGLVALNDLIIGQPVVIITPDSNVRYDSMTAASKALDVSLKDLSKAMKTPSGFIGNIGGVPVYIDEPVQSAEDKQKNADIISAMTDKMI